MTVAARRRIVACFALAERATIAGERDAALNRGKALAAAAGLSLDEFDVPGRPRSASRRPADKLFEGGPFSGWQYIDLGDFDLGELATMRARMNGETRGAQVFAERAARERARRDNVRREALNFLWSKGVRIYAEGAGWLAPEETLVEGWLDEDGMVGLAKLRGWRG